MIGLLANLRRSLGIRMTRLPWAELEAEARRQGCSPADIFFDRAGQRDLPLATSQAKVPPEKEQ